MLMSFPCVMGLLIFISIDIKFGEIPVSDLVGGPGGEDINVIVIVLI